eukprot:m.57644 g.57644  ORF g.57644 m.57644 type:complete len:643 (+) comp7779_c0_seq1:171-2099(+)
MTTVSLPDPCLQPTVVVNASQGYVDLNNASSGSSTGAATPLVALNVPPPSHAHRDVANFTLFASITPQSNPPHGYLFARSTLSGSRYMSLYFRRSEPRTAVLYYRVRGQTTQRSASFPVALAPGQTYGLRLTVIGASAILEVRSALFDFGVHQVQLAGVPAHCRVGVDTDCAVLVGARPNMASTATVAPAVWDAASTAYGFAGRVHFLLVAPACGGLSLDELVQNQPALAPHVPTVAPGTTGVPTTTGSNGGGGGSGAPCVDVLALADASQVASGAVTLSSTSGQRLVPLPAVSGAAFSIAMTVQPTVGDSGYLFAKTNTAGSTRPYSLYLAASTSTVRFYYSASAGSTLRVDFVGALAADGAYHQVVLTVSSTAALLLVDGTPYRQRLAAAVRDCGAATSSVSDDCTFVLGARSAGSAATAYPLGGHVKHAVVCPLVPLVVAPARGHPQGVNLLRSISASVGANGLDVVTGQQVQTVGTLTPTVTLAVQLTALSPGMVFAKSNANGTRMHFAVEALSTAVRIHAWVATSPTSSPNNTTNTVARVVDVAVDSTLGGLLVDGSRHTVFVSLINGTMVTVGVDNRAPVHVALNGTLVDCGVASADCVSFVGRRAWAVPDTLFGTIHEAFLLPGQAWSSWIPPLV